MVARVLGMLGWVVVLCASVSPAMAERAILPASRDNTLIESSSGDLSSGSGPNFRAGRTGQAMGSIRRGVLAFDVAAAVPAGSEILDATLILTMTHSNTGAQPLSVHRLLADWGEGASSSGGGVGAPAQPGDATWVHRLYDTVFWDTPGGDFTASPSAEAVVDGPGVYVWNAPEMATDVQLWLDLPATNHGWLVRGNEDVSGSTVKAFTSREVATPGVPPLLMIDYVPSGGDDEDEDEDGDENGDDD